MSYSNAIFEYDWARWRAQKTHFETDLTNNSALGLFGLTKTTEVAPTAKNVNETKTRYPGTRYVYNVVTKVNHPKSNTQQVNDVNRLIAVRPAPQGPGWICSGKAKADIAKAGFVPLALFNTGGIGLGKSVCRLNPTPL